MNRQKEKVMSSCNKLNHRDLEFDDVLDRILKDSKNAMKEYLGTRPEDTSLSKYEALNQSPSIIWIHDLLQLTLNAITPLFATVEMLLENTTLNLGTGVLHTPMKKFTIKFQNLSHEMSCIHSIPEMTDDSAYTKDSNKKVVFVGTILSKLYLLAKELFTQYQSILTQQSSQILQLLENNIKSVEEKFPYVKTLKVD